MSRIKKTVYTLCVDNYEPEITAITFPYLQQWADKIEANFHIITERKHPEFPPVYEKFQIYDLAQEHANDWNIFFDADTLIHPDFFDVTSVMSKDITMSNGSDFVPHRFRPNKYFLRDGRMIGKGNWCAIVSDWCLDYWKPLEEPVDEVIKNIFPTTDELKFGMTKCHLVDDYTVSNNIARFGLRHVLIPEIAKNFPSVKPNMLEHQYLMRPEQKIIHLQKTLQNWGLV